MQIIRSFSTFAILTSTFLSTEAHAGVIQGAWVGCLSEEYLDQFIAAAAQKDLRLMQSMIGTTCVGIDGHQFSVLDRGILVTEIRVYIGDDYVDLFVPAEAAR